MTRLDRNRAPIAACAVIATFAAGAVFVGSVTPEARGDTLEIAGVHSLSSAAPDTTTGTTATAPTIRPVVEPSLVVSGATPPTRGSAVQVTDTVLAPVRLFADFDCDWIADGLTARGVRAEWVDFAVATATRESACCPNLRGGDRTDGATCTVVRVAETTHRSDTGAFQFNGVWWRGPGTDLCDTFAVCDQDTLLGDPDLQLDLFVYVATKCGRGPWNTSGFYCRPAEVLRPHQRPQPESDTTS